MGRIPKASVFKRRLMGSRGCRSRRCKIVHDFVSADHLGNFCTLLYMLLCCFHSFVDYPYCYHCCSEISFHVSFSSRSLEACRPFPVRIFFEEEPHSRLTPLSPSLFYHLHHCHNSFRICLQMQRLFNAHMRVRVRVSSFGTATRRANVRSNCFFVTCTS